MFRGVDSDAMAVVMGCGRWYLRNVALPELVRRGYASRVNKGHSRLYYLTKKGRCRLLEEEERLRVDSLAVIARAKAVGLERSLYVAGEVEQMEEELRKGMI
jgi:hypothetical protein